MAAISHLIAVSLCSNQVAELPFGLHVSADGPVLLQSKTDLKSPAISRGLGWRDCLRAGRFPSFRLCFHHFAPIILPYVFGLPSASARASNACSLGG